MMTVHYNAQVLLSDEDNLGRHQAGSQRSRRCTVFILLFLWRILVCKVLKLGQLWRLSEK